MGLNDRFSGSEVADLATSVLTSRLPYIRGTWYHVDGDIGSDAEHADGSEDHPFKTLKPAYDKCVSGRGDGILIHSRTTASGSNSIYLTAAIEWASYGITVYGDCAPTMFAQRARIANASSLTDASYLINVTGANNRFINLHFYNGGATGTGCIKLTGGERNYFYNVHMIGAGGVTTAGTSDNDLTLSGASENTFRECVIGSDTKDRGNNASASLHFASGCMRNRFIDCEIVSYHSSGTGGGAIKFDGSGDAITRDNIFKGCCITCYDEANGSAQTSVVIGTAPNNGCIIFFNSMMNGYADWCAVDAARVLTNMPAAADTGGKALAQNPS